MTLGTHFKYLFRKSSFFRFVVYICILAIVSVCLLFINHLGMTAPVVTDMNPVVGEPGDTLTITGKCFGKKQTSSYVEIGNNRITSSLYITWEDNKIELVLPQNIDDGLVYVCTKAGRSEPRMFANKQIIPVPVEPNLQVTIPIITKLNTKKTSTGRVITINGSNFGELREDSCVLFPTAEKDEKFQPVMIECSATNNDYQYWSATEIQVRVPDGAVSGDVVVKTEKGTSEGIALEIVSSAGFKTYTNKLTYVLSVNADVTDVISDKSALITFFVPKPVSDSRQRDFTLQKSEPESAISDFMDTVVQQLEINSPTEKKSVSESYVLSVWGVETSIKEWNVNSYSARTKTIYNKYLTPNMLIPSDDETLIEVAKSIVGAQKNPWKKAKLIYDYLVQNFTVLPELRVADADVLDMLDSNEGDAYDFAILYTALLRASGIPAVTDAGVLVDSDLTAKNHWWCEFYLEDIGWIPVDPAMGAGYVFGSFVASDSAKDDHFGKIDSRHIAFSHGLNEIKPAYSNSKKVYRPKTWALMSIWEEASVNTKEYSSFWSDVIVTGVY
ncbi:MAG: hypothetical protein BKP49_02940 [Treponema sp. CETP13]|nr:MAG: hypothetical protein BKP49_02940 [Treponema sp. CETP13]